MAGPSSLSGATATLNPVNDAYVNDSDPTGTFNNTLLVAGKSPAEFTPRYRSLLRFDLSGIPTNAIVSSAVLRLNLQAFESSSSARIGAHHVLASWSSGTLTWNNQPAFASAPSASTAVGTGIGANYQWTVTGLVQDWVEGQFVNYGLALIVTNETIATATRTFASLNHTNVASRPELVVTYALPADIAVTPTSLGFGNQRVGTTSAVQNVTVLNSGGSTLWISNVTSSSSQFRIEGTPPFPAFLDPGASGMFQVRFAPTSPGAKNGTVNILSSDKDEPNVALPCTGTGVAPDVDVMPMTLSFGNQLLGTTSSLQIVTIQNTGSADLHVTSISSSSSEFAPNLTASLPAIVVPGSNLLFGVRFAPTGVGAKSGIFTVTSDDPDEATRTVSCSGTGVVPDIEVIPATLTFGNQSLGTTSPPQMVTIQNAGSAILRVTSIGPSNTQFPVSVGTNLPAMIAPGNNLMFQVRFNPASTGARGGTISIASDDPDEPTRIVTCSGTGIGPHLTVMPTAISFGTVTLGTTARRPLALQNLGNTNLVITVLTSSNSVLRLGNVPLLPLTLAPGQTHTLSVDYTPVSALSDPGIVRIESDDPFTPGIIVPVGGGGAAPLATGCDQPPVNGVMPVITSPDDGSTHILGNPIRFQAENAVVAQVLCNADCYELCWYFRKVPDQQWADVAGYQFTPGRLLGCDQAMPLPGDYEVLVRMCGVTSAPVAFHVVLNPGISDPSQLHPLFADTNRDDYRCHLDWTNSLNPDRLATAHFNVIWTTNGYARTETNGLGCHDLSGVSQTNNRPSDLRLGLVECAWATFARWMTSPLDDSALFQDLPEYSGLTHLTWWVGGPGGGGTSQPMGFGYGQEAQTLGNSWIPVHEMFHTWDYAGNPLHNKGRFDRRNQGNPYVFLHESVTRVVQTLATNSATMYGYKTDRWPVWTPLDMGLIELGYDAGLFWSYLLNSYPFAPRLKWEGPSICACAQWAETNRPPHNLELFELWYARVRERIRSELGPNEPLTSYRCEEEHWPSSDNTFFIYNGHTNPVCYQTLEYELAVLEGILHERFPYHETPLADSLLADFAVKFAEAFPPRRLTNGLPQVVECTNLAGLYFSQGFTNAGWTESLVCDGATGFNTNDFYARIRFRLLDDTIRRLRLTANDEATFYLDGRAVIEPVGSAFPNASTTYADQRDGDGLVYTWDGTAQPRSSVFAVNDPTNHTFEIEWVNRGDGKGNGDYDISGPLSRYFLLLESCDSLDETTAVGVPISSNQVEILSVQFWPDQGSGAPGFRSAPDWNLPIDPSKEIQLRPVFSGERPFFLPPLAVNYHPVGSPTGYVGSFSVTVRHDGLTHTRPSAHLLVLTTNGIQWRGPLDQVDADTQRVHLQSCGDGSPATYEGNPALILVVARRTFHGSTNGTNGTLGAIHYTVGIAQRSFSVEPDRYDTGPLGNPPNNTLANATLLPNVAGGDVFSGPGRGPDRIWRMVVPGLTLPDVIEQDFFRLDLPDEAGDDCLDALPECANDRRVGNGMLEIIVHNTGAAEIIAYDALGGEIARDNNYLRIGCPRESGLDPFSFAVTSQSGCLTAYSLEIIYSVPDAGLWEQFGDMCIPCPPSECGFDEDDSFRVITPPQESWDDFTYGINCDPIVCQPPKHDYLFFHWDFAGPAEFEFQHEASVDFQFALLDAQFSQIGSASRSGGARAVGFPQGIELMVTQQLRMAHLPTGYYVLRVSGSQFGSTYSMRWVPPPGSELRIDPASVEFAGGQIRFRWFAQPGQRYRVQYTERLGEILWMNLGGEIAATGSTVTFLDSGPATTKRFYRILRLD